MPHGFTGLCLLALFLLFGLGTEATDLYIGPDGTPTGPGTWGQPYDLATALSGEVSQPGDTFWLRGGDYRLGHLETTIEGATGRPITFRQMPGEKARVDGSMSFFESGGYVILRDFEIYSSDTNRASSQMGVGFNVTDIQIIPGIASFSPNLSFINLIVHDQTRHGIYVARTASNNVVYGCIIYNNGWISRDNAEGHGLHVQGLTGATEIADNVVLNNSGASIHLYDNAAGSRLAGIMVDGNVAFGAGAIQNVRPYRDWIVGVDAPAVSAHGVVLKNNMGYVSPGSGTPEEVEIGREGRNGSASLLNNYLPQGIWMKNWSNATVTGNSFVAQKTCLVRLEETQNSLQALWDQNTYRRSATGRDFLRDATEYDFSGWRNTTGFDQRSTYTIGNASGTKVFVRPNRYEAGRANIIVYNWDNLNRVAVDISSVLEQGAAYEVRNAGDFLAAPVLSGVYDGRPVELPMTGLTVAVPNGPLLTPSPTGPTFNVFVIQSRSVRLKVVCVDGRPEISWPTNAGTWGLQFSSSPQDWVDYPNRPTIRGDDFVVRDSVSSGSRFYRLRASR
jgi:parallel beta-helix repeat protein